MLPLVAVASLHKADDGGSNPESHTDDLEGNPDDLYTQFQESKQVVADDACCSPCSPLASHRLAFRGVVALPYIYFLTLRR